MITATTDSARAVASAGIMMAVVFIATTPSSAADGNTPHPHRGVLAAYDTLPEITLDEKQLERLGKGRIVTMTVVDEHGNGRGVAVIDIAAPTDVVWSRVMGFEHYPQWVGPVKEAEILARNGDTYRTRTKVSGFLYKYEYYLVNTYHPDKSMMTWTLDYDRYSDFDDCVGAWVVATHPEKEGWSRAWFSTDLALRKPPPGFVMNWIKKKGLKDATSWVKRESERVMGGNLEVNSDTVMAEEWEF